MSKKPIKSDLKRIVTTDDKDIDYSDIPEFDEAFLQSVEAKISTGKKAISLRMDTEVLEWMQSQGKGYQSRINAVLRAYYEAHKDRPSS